MSEAPSSKAANDTLHERRPHPGFRAAATVYVLAFVVMASFSGYMLLVRGQPWTSPPVIAPALAGLYFLLRFMMTARSRRTRD